MRKERIIVADESLYRTWILMNLDIRELERIEEKLGSTIATNDIADNATKWVKRALSSDQIIVWNRKIIEDNVRYLKITQDYSTERQEVFSIIESDTKNLLGLLHIFDRGASHADVNLLASAQWIGTNTPFEPVVVTEDRDLLGAGHAISSYLGLQFGFLSLFEVLRSTGMLHLLRSYFEQCEIPLTTIVETGQPFSAADLTRDMNNLARKTKIAFHPTLRKGDDIRRITRQTRRS